MISEEDYQAKEEDQNELLKHLRRKCLHYIDVDCERDANDTLLEIRELMDLVGLGDRYPIFREELDKKRELYLTDERLN